MHGGVVVTNGHCKVGRVHHHEVGFGHCVDAAALRHFPLFLPDLAFDLWVAVRLLAFLLHFLVRHFELIALQVGLQRDVHQRRQQNNQQKQAQATGQPFREVANGCP